MAPTGRTSQQQLAELLASWREDPVAFVEEAFDPPPEVEEWQRKALANLRDHDRLAIRSGHGVGKSAFASWVILWFLLTRYPAKVPCTAPTAHQLEDVLWSELATWHRRLRPYLSDLVEVGAGRATHAAAPKESFAVARTARQEQPEAFQGFHGKNLLFVVDEASGVPEIIFEVGEGALSTPGAKVLMLGNPTKPSGYFHAAFHPKPGEHPWHTMHVPCTASSRVDPKWIERMRARYGEDSPVYRVRVLGEFPETAGDTVVPMALATAAVQRDIEPYEAPVLWGLDVSRAGADRCALAKRAGKLMLEPMASWHYPDLMQTVGRVAHEYEITPQHMRPAEIMVDVIGLGAGVFDRLRQMRMPVVAVNVAEASSSRDQYLRLRDELWFRVREWFQGLDVRLPDNTQDLLDELCSVRYSVTSGGKIRVETKDEMSRRGMASPDLADAFILTFAGSRRYDPDRAFAAKADFVDVTRTESGYDPFSVRRNRAV